MRVIYIFRILLLTRTLTQSDDPLCIQKGLTKTGYEKFQCECSTSKFEGGTLSSYRGGLDFLPARGKKFEIFWFRCNKITIRMTHSLPAKRLNFEISGIKKLELEDIKLSRGQEVKIVVRNVSESTRISWKGSLKCDDCGRESLIPRHSAMKARESNSPMISLHIRNLHSFKITNFQSSESLRLSVKDVERFLVVNSTFDTLGWPGFFLYNVSSVKLINNTFLDVAPHSIVCNKGGVLTMENNILDIPKALKVIHFPKLFLRCNRYNISEPYDERESCERAKSESVQNTLAIILILLYAQIGALSYVIIFWILCIFLLIAFLLWKYFYRKPQKPQTVKEDASHFYYYYESEKNPEGGVARKIRRKSTYGDEYSNSSRLHLAGEKLSPAIDEDN